MEKQKIKLEYVEYLNSPAWKSTRIRFYKSKYNKNECYICKKKGICLDLHHKTYERLGKERLTDLVQLCRKCHEAIHVILERHGDEGFTLWNAAVKCKTIFKKRGQAGLDAAVNTETTYSKNYLRKKRRKKQNKNWLKKITRKKQKNKCLLSHEKAYKDLCNFEKISKKQVKFRKKNRY
jgi:hypothetical protein